MPLSQPRLQPFDTVYETFSTGAASYAIAYYYLFPGTDKITPTAIKAIVSAVSGKDASVRIYDFTNALTVAELTAESGTALHIVDLGTLSNLSSGEAIWEIQLKKGGGGGGTAVIRNVQVQY